MKTFLHPTGVETVALQALEAAPNVRLACQLRPTASLTVTILHHPAVPGPMQVDFVEIKSVVAAHARAVLGNETVDNRERRSASARRVVRRTSSHIP